LVKKMVGGGAGNGDGEALEGFLGEGGGFVLYRRVETVFEMGCAARDGVARIAMREWLGV
jgi:hypothetical protein